MVISTRNVKTRKEHNCFGCAIKYPRSTRMTIVNWLDGSQLTSYYWCEICDSFWQKYMTHEDEIGEGDLISEPEYRKYKEEYPKSKENDTK